MRHYYLPCPYGFPSQLTKPGCVSSDELFEIIEREFPFEVDLLEYSSNLPEMRAWLNGNFGEHVQSIQVCPETFAPHATSVDAGAFWCFYRDYRYRFKSINDAILFKLTWGGR